MSDNGYIAGLNGTRIPLEMETIDDAFGNVIVRHEYPHVNGADLENTGQTGRTVRLRCYFWDEPNHLGYDNHKALLQLLDESGLLELTHPVYGLLKGMAEQINVRHVDDQRYCEVDFSFIQQLRDKTAAVQVVDVVASMEQAYQDMLSRLQDSDVDVAISDSGVETAVIDAVDLGEVAAVDILQQFTGLTQAGWLYVQQAAIAVRTFEGTMVEIAVPANRLISTIDFTTTLPGRLLGSLANCIERYAILAEKNLMAPARFVASLQEGLIKLAAICPDYAGQIHAIGSARACLSLGDIFQADNNAARANRATAGTPLFDAHGAYVSSPPPEAVLTVREMEDGVATARAWLQEAFDLDRNRVELKQIALALLDHLNQVKVEREKLVSVTIDQPLPLHLVCHGHGLSWRDAERLLLVNRIPLPNAVKGEVLVYVQ